MMMPTIPDSFHKKATTLFVSCFFLTFLTLLGSCQNPSKESTCTDILDCISISPEEPIRIGVLQSLSGKTAPLSLAQIRGFELALDKRKNRLLAHPIAANEENAGKTDDCS